MTRRTPQSHTFWTDARVADLRRRAAEGWSASDIGKAFGTTKNAIIGKCDREGIQLAGDRARWSAKLSARNRALHQAGCFGPAWRAAMSRATKAAWADPAKRQRLLEGAAAARAAKAAAA